MILGNNPVLVAIRTVFLAGFYKPVIKGQSDRKEAKERPLLSESRVPGWALLVSPLLHIPWSQALSAGLTSTVGFLAPGNGATGHPTCLLEWLKNAEVGVEMQELAFVRVGSRGWRHQDHPKWKTHAFRGSVDGGGHEALGSPLGEGGGLKRSKPTLFQPDLCAVSYPKICKPPPLLKLQLTLDSSHLCWWNPQVLFGVLHSFPLCCCKTWVSLGHL
jgi:hypothetical protein